MKLQLLCVMALVGASSARALSPLPPPTCVNTGPTRECIMPMPMPRPPTAPPLVHPEPPSDNLLINGSFEQPVLAPGGWSVFSVVPGWAAVDGPGIEVQRDAAGPAQHGKQLVELDSHGNSAMVQAVAVQAGATYELRFWTMARPGTAANTNGLDVFVNDVRVHRVRHGHAVGAQAAVSPHGSAHDELPPHLLAARQAALGFQEVQLLWTAGPDVTQAVLRFEASGCSDSLGSYLDNVSWRAVGRD